MKSVLRLPLIVTSTILMVALLAAVRCYQLMISPWLGNNCRFHPTCSEYFAQSVRKRGVVRGSLRGIARICRCHPFHPGGVDPP
jgi:putative membrane protein insertion efficiency factor